MHALFDEWQLLAAQLGRACVAHGSVIAGAESCTGGLVAAVLTSVSGSSAWVDRALVTYSNTAKRDLLGVRAETLDTFGAVSEATAREMALGALRTGDARVSVGAGVGTRDPAANLGYAITGVAGPTGGTPAKPVGMVCFAFATRNTVAAGPEFTVTAMTRHFQGDRHAVREQSVNFVLAELLRLTR